MTVAFRHGEKLKYKCDVCGKVDFWQPGCSTYSSIQLEEVCPWDLPTACSEECCKVMIAKIKSGEWELPVVGGSSYLPRVVKQRVGY